LAFLAYRGVPPRKHQERQLSHRRGRRGLEAEGAHASAWHWRRHLAQRSQPVEEPGWERAFDGPDAARARVSGGVHGEVQHLGAHATHAHEDAVGVV
jgi:hypothetical protein